MCRAENSIGRFETKARLIVLPTERRKQAPIFRQPLTDKTETEGNTAVFEVTVDAEPAAQFKWTLNGQELCESDVSLLCRQTFYNVFSIFSVFTFANSKEARSLSSLIANSPMLVFWNALRSILRVKPRQSAS